MGERQLPELYPGWKTVRKLGSGSFGTVYEIERDLFGKIEKAALKCISIPQNDGDVEEMYSNGYDDASITAHFETYLANIVREYSMMVEMKGHTNVVYCDDIRYIPREDGIGWDITIKMELLTPLIKTLGPDFGEEQVIRLGKDLCRALALCKDRDIVHRDIKPQNIFVSKTGDYKLGDFGIAKTVEQTTGGTKIGTYSYMAPEVYHNKPYGSSADIYSLGLVMYWLLNERRLPFLPLPPKSPTYDETEMARHRRFMGEAIPAPQKGSEELKRIVLKACAFDPQERYASAQEMLDALERIGQAEPVVNKVDMLAKTAVVDTALDETCGPVFGTVSAATATMTEGPVFTSREVREDNKTKNPVFVEKPAAEPKTAEAPSWSAEHRDEKMGPRTIEVPKLASQPVEEQPSEKNKLWIIGACAAVLLVVISFAVYSMYHIWSDPTCTAPATCSICNKTQGDALGHRFVDADCEKPKHCVNCGIFSGMQLGHQWTDGKCTVCGAISTTGQTPENEGPSKGDEPVVESFYHNGELIAWTEYGNTAEQEVISYTYDGKQVNWYEDGELVGWQFEHYEPYSLFFVEGKVYYFYDDESNDDGEIAYLANVAHNYVSFPTYTCGRVPHINLLKERDVQIRDYNTSTNIAGQAVLAYDVFGNDYVIIHYGNTNKNPEDTVIVESTFNG